MKKLKTIIILLNFLLILGIFHYSIIKKEGILSEGKLVLLELAPVDPRSLMQGDYMDLRYAIAQNINLDSIPANGYCVAVDSARIARAVRLQKNKTPLLHDEYLIEYSIRQRGWDIHIGAESFFFQEGQATKYEKAKYGGLRIDKDGNSILIGLYDENKQLIQ